MPPVVFEPSRYAALPLLVLQPYSYTLDTLIQPANRVKISVACPFIPTLQHVLALAQGIAHFIWRQGGAIIRSYLLYQPAVSCLAGF